MKLPKKISIEGKQWTVIRKWRIVENGVECDGLCVSEKREIWVCHGLPEAEAFQIFMHEYLHAVFIEKGIHLLSIPPEVEEMLVHGISKELCETFSLKLKTQRSKEK